MAFRKLSEITPAVSPPATTDYFVGVQGGNIDALFTLSQVGRRKLTADANYYVATTGSDAAGDGTIGNPWATVQYAINFVAGNIDFSGHRTTINIGAGTFAGASVPSTASGGILMIQGAGSTQTIITDDPADSSGAISVGRSVNLPAHRISAIVAINALTLRATINEACLWASYSHNEVWIGDPSTNSADIILERDAGGAGTYFIGALFEVNIIIVPGLVTINSATPATSYSAAFYCAGHGADIHDQGTWTVTGAPTFSLGFATALDEANINSFGGFAGAVTGPRFFLGSVTSIDVLNGSLTYFPGSLPGVFESGSGTAATYSGYHTFRPTAGGVPSASDLIDQSWGVFKDTATGFIYVAARDGAAIKTVQLT